MKNDRNIIAHWCVISFLITMAFICGTAYAGTATPAGHAIFVHDAVWRITADEVKQPLLKGDSVYETDTIVTGDKGSAQLVMSDGAYLAIRPNTSIRLDVYHYDREEPEGFGESVITLLKGCFRSITGLIGKENKENYTIKTPVASIGIRGTDHEPLYIPEPAEGEVSIGEPGLYDKVNSGETYIENDAGIVTILPNEVGYVPDRTTLAVVDDTIPDVYEQFSAAGSEDSADTSESESTEPVMDAGGVEVFAGTESLQEQADAQEFAQEFTPELDPGLEPGIEPEPEPDPEPVIPVIEYSTTAQYAGVFTWPDAATFKGVLGFGADETDVQTDDSGNLTGYQLQALASPDLDWIQRIQLVNPTEATRDESGHYSETTIEYGTWKAEAIATTSYGGILESFPVGDGLIHWIQGQTTGVDYVSQVISGTQAYTFDGGTAPTNQDGIAGILSNASLSVDFSRQALDVALDLSVNSHDWSASGTDIPIDRGTFEASNPLLTVERDGATSPSIWGNLNGTFAGEGLSGALLGYTVGDYSISETVNGAASFYAPAQDTTVTYRDIGIAGTDPRAPMPSTLALNSSSATANISMDGSGSLTGFDSRLPKYNFTGAVDSHLPVHMDLGVATLTDTGSDPDSGISWGRWSGTLTSTDRVTGASTSPSFDPQELHYIAGPEMSTPVTLPITGTKTYAFAGGTHPTDNLGNIGTLKSASLAADFTNMTVATGINATVGSTTFDASSSATPIENGRYFTATHNDSLSLACTGTGAGTTHAGVISGAFYGEHGESAGMAYSFNTTDGAGIDTTISGTAAFK